MGDIVVANRMFCLASPVLIIVGKKPSTSLYQRTGFSVIDCEGQLLLDAESEHFSVRGRTNVVDSYGRQIFTLRAKTVEDFAWYVFNGHEKRHDSNLAFTVKKEGAHSFCVYLPGISEPKFFVILQQGVFYLTSGDRLLAEIKRGNNMSRYTLNYEVTVSAGVDYAFVAAVVMIMLRIHKDSQGNDEINKIVKATRIVSGIAGNITK